MGSNTPKIIFTGFCIFIACIGLSPFNTARADLFDKMDMRDTATCKMLRDSFINKQELKKPALVKVEGTVSRIESKYHRYGKNHKVQPKKFAFMEVTTKSGKYKAKTDIHGRFTILFPAGCTDTLVVKKETPSGSFLYYYGTTLPIKIADRDTTVEMQLKLYYRHYTICPRF
jgi:hypothetical protein